MDWNVGVMRSAEGKAKPQMEGTQDLGWLHGADSPTHSGMPFYLLTLM